ncbi:MAG: alanine--tRNA ligase [Erysipelotrichaceae bacterium]
MKQLSSAEIRRMFLQYFEENGHMIEPGASLIPHNDPTLLWINAGVAALKKYFDGTERPKNRRITNAQKSIRTNDIENVGKTARHHTFFEMLGNFSIGDYFKKEAIPFAWHFLTDARWMGFDKDRLYITVYIDDQEAYDIWTKDCKVDPSHILKTADNFWEIGNGPCGPDSEIFYDRGEKYDPLHLGEKLFFEEMENDRYIEIWNIVFSQYNSQEGLARSEYKELPQKNIDTGMGLERLVSIVQDGETNFDTDLFLPIIRATEKMTDKKYEGENKMAYRVIADHIRTVTFAISDGATFSNEGRGYILRRVLRRAVRYGKKLNINQAYMYKLVEVVAENMKDYYPYLLEKVDYVSKLVKAEEERFENTLNDGERILQTYLQNNTTKQLDGETVFKLYDTYGFPVELTKEIALEHDITIDEEGFNQCMQQQRERARNARSDDQSMGSQSVDLLNFVDKSEFIGYDHLENHSKVIALFKDGVRVDELTDEGDVVVSQSCFYAESGGQIYDTGIMENSTTLLEVTKVTKAPLKQFLHHVVVKKGSVKVNDELDLKINAVDRSLIKANHSSLHLLQAALQKVVGSHIHQAGSYVCSQYARFDFTHFEKLTYQQIKEVERLVNEQISLNLAVDTQLMDIETAKNSGAMALFDEKYDDVVRVVSMGDFSKELCGGTHVSSTGEIGIFKIVSEESVGSGIRRITSKTNFGAYQQTVAQQDLLVNICNILKVNSEAKIIEKLEQFMKESEQRSQMIKQLKEKMASNTLDELLKQAKSINGYNVVIKKIGGDAAALKPMASQLADKLQKAVILLYTVNDGRITFVASCSKDAIDQGIKANNVVKLASSITGGNGGGKDDVASAGGKDVTKLQQAVEAVEELINK